MAATNICRAVVSGNLTADPELRSLPSGISVCKLRVACNTARKDPTTGEWGTKPNYFDVIVWGAQGENCARYLHKGRGVLVDGRLDWREWTTQDGNQKREKIEINADQVQFLNERGEVEVPDIDDGAEFEPVPVAAGVAGLDDDIPF